MSGRSLDALFRPRSVAVVGASRRAGSIGGAVLRNLVAGGFEGPVYPVNREAKHVQSLPAWPTLSALPEVPDLAVVCVPAAAAVEAVEEAARLKVPACAVITAGFAEAGPRGKELERRLVAAARGSGMRLLGPNCLGLQNPDPAVRLDATFATTFAPDGGVLLASQSGALGLAALDYARDLGLGFSAFASLGNKCEVSGNDVLEWAERDPRTRLALLYLESLGNPRRFREIAARVSRVKPIALVKSGRSTAGVRATASHTAALAGPDAAVSALCAQTGVIRADTLEQLFDVAMVLANQPLPRGRRVAVVTNAGGPGILAADALEDAGLVVPRLAPETEAALRAFLRPEASVQNPVDILADGGSEAYGKALRAVLADPGVDAVLALFVPPITSGAQETARAIVGALNGEGKPVLSCFMGTHGVPEGLATLQGGHVPSFRFPEGAARALALVASYAEWRRSPEAAPEVVPGASEAARRALADARKRLGPEGGWLDADERVRLADAWGLSLAPQRRSAPTPAAAAGAAAAMGCPVVLKAEAPGVVHKSEMGAVALGLQDAQEVARAAERMLALSPTAFVVQRQIEGGDEWLVGAVRDAAYGPLVTVGAGGQRAELWRDVTRRLAPLSPVDVDALLDGPRVGKALAGWRGSPALDRGALARFVRALGFVACAHPEIAELEANPVKVLNDPQGAVAVDLRVRLGPAG